VRTRDEIAGELAVRDAFFATRLIRQGRLRDLTNVLLGTAADILQCERCGILVRDHAPDQGAFAEDHYERAELESLHAVHAAAFGEKRDDYGSLLQRGSRVAEVGSYVGGFLAVARQCGCDATGVDIGADTARFTRALGFDVRSRPFEQCGFEDESFDAVFVWNCFEQLIAPRVALAEAHRILAPGGALVLRVPDAAFYVQRPGVAALAYNGLLGWPHRFGFSAASLRRLAAEHGFTLKRVRHAPAIRPDRDVLRAWARAEERALIAEGALGWIELTFQSPASS